MYRFVWLIFALITDTAHAEKPALMLAKTYHDNIEISDYWVSEKLDGVRARWNGKYLISRGGNTFAAPKWFTADFPNMVIDGELWTKRSDYENISSITSRKQPHTGWKNITFMAFDLPEHTGTFSERVAVMQQFSATHLAPVKQRKFPSLEKLTAHLDTVIANGGEGLMLHHQDAHYSTGRSGHLLKLKKFTDAEALVIEHIPGNGKYTDMLGAIKVKFKDKIFKIGSGFTDKQRGNPPPLGSTVTFKHQGFTKNDIPRFPVFLRVRKELQE